METWQSGRLRQTVNLFLIARWFESIRLHHISGDWYTWLTHLVCNQEQTVRIRYPPPSLGLKVFTDAHDTVTVEEGDRYPLGPPSFRIATANSKISMFMKKKCYPVLLYSGRLVARTPAFQVGEAGSKPVRSTKFCKCQQENVTLSRFLRRTKTVEG